MYLLRWLHEGFGYDEVAPSVGYWTLRVLMLTLSIVLEDWAVLEMVQSPRQHRVAILLIASSYVTWTLQTHTFSNSLETLLVAWSLVLTGRIVEDKVGANRRLLLNIQTTNRLALETLRGICFCSAGLSNSGWCFQPHHISCFRTFPGVQPSSAFSKKVCFVGYLSMCVTNIFS